MRAVAYSERHRSWFVATDRELLDPELIGDTRDGIVTYDGCPQESISGPFESREDAVAAWDAAEDAIWDALALGVD